MTFALLLSLSVAAFAAETSVTEVQRMVEQDGYLFTITEKTNTNYAVVGNLSRIPHQQEQL